MSKKYLTVIGAISTFFAFPISSFASCVDYPYRTIGAKIIPTENNNIKVISSYRVGVNFDDSDEVVDAIAEARSEAKASIADLMTTEIAKDCARSSKKLSRKLLSKDPTGTETIQVDDEKVKETICNLVGNTRAVLNGVASVGQCYEPGKHVYVTIGIKPETIAAASQLGENMRSIKKLNDIKGGSQNGGNSTRNVEGFSDFDADF